MTSRRRPRPHRPPLAGPGPEPVLDPDPGVARTIAGYSVVRRLGQGRRSDIYLGHSATGVVTAKTGCVNPVGHGVPEGCQVALKVFRGDVDGDSVEREIHALTTCRSGLVRLLDLATLEDGRVCVVLERLKGMSLAHYLDRYGPLTPGEAVTVLAPMIVALAELHAAGLAHTGLSLASILIDERGRPVLLGLGSLISLPAPSADRTALLRADYARLAVLVREVLTDPDPRRMRASGTTLVARCEAAATVIPFVPCLPQLEHDLFGWASASALTFGQSVPDPATIRSDSTGRDLARASVSSAAAPRTSADAGRLSLGLAADSAEMLRSVIECGRFLRTRLVSTLHRLVSTLRRRSARPTAPGQRSGTRPWGRVVYTVILATMATTAALIVVPADPTDRPSVDRTGPSTRPAAPSSDAAALLSDDPIAAAQVLLRLRAQCLAAASVACLEATNQSGGPLMVADTQALASRAGSSAFPAGEDITAEDVTVELVERSGNSALLALSRGNGETKPASTLIIKGEAGWRLRALLDY